MPLHKDLTSRAAASGCRDSRSRWPSNRTICTCSNQVRADAAARDHTRTRARSSSSRTTRNASRRHDAREAGPARKHIRVRNWTSRNACISYSCQISLPAIIPQTTVARCQALGDNNGTSAALLHHSYSTIGVRTSRHPVRTSFSRHTLFSIPLARSHVHWCRRSSAPF